MVKCCKCKTKEAIGYFGIGDPDIEPIPLCEECKLLQQFELFKIFEGKNGK